MLNRNEALVLLVLVPAVMFAGCGGDYPAEKAYWKAQNTHKDKLKDPANATQAEFEAMVGDLRSIIAAHPLWKQSVELQFYIAEMYARKKDFASASEEFKKVIMNFPEKYEFCARAQFALGVLADQQGDEKKALREYEITSDRYQMTATGLQVPLFIAQRFKSQGNLQDAREAYMKAVRKYQSLIDANPYSKVTPLLNDYIVTAYISSGDTQNAVNVLVRFVEKYPDTPGAPAALFELAGIYREVLKKPDAAIEIYKQIMEKYPENKMDKELRMLIGTLYATTGDYLKAEDTYKELVSKYPADAPLGITARMALAASYDASGKWNDARAEYESILKSNPASTQALSIPLIIANHYKAQTEAEERAKAFSEAIFYYEELRNKDNRSQLSAMAQEFIAEAYLLQGKYTESIAALDLFRSMYPASQRIPEVLLKTALIYEQKIKDVGRAQEAYERLLKEYPTDKLAVMAKKRLEGLAGQERTR